VRKRSKRGPASSKFWRGISQRKKTKGGKPENVRGKGGGADRRFNRVFLFRCFGGKKAGGGGQGRGACLFEGAPKAFFSRTENRRGRAAKGRFFPAGKSGGAAAKKSPRMLHPTRSFGAQSQVLARDGGWGARVRPEKKIKTKGGRFGTAGAMGAPARSKGVSRRGPRLFLNWRFRGSCGGGGEKNRRPGGRESRTASKITWGERLEIVSRAYRPKPGKGPQKNGGKRVP